MAAAPQHVTQRGNNSQQTFFSDAQRRHYLVLPGQYTRLHELRILGYCLPPNQSDRCALRRKPSGSQEFVKKLDERASVSLELEYSGSVLECAQPESRRAFSLRG